MSGEVGVSFFENPLAWWQRRKEYAQILKDLGLKERDLKGKKVVDLGCGDGTLVLSLLGRKVTKHAYGVDLDPDFNDTTKFPKGKFFTKDYNEPFPDELKGADLVVVRQSMDLNPTEYNSPKHPAYKAMKENIEERLANAPRLLGHFMSLVKPGGELRATPYTVEGKNPRLEDQRYYHIVKKFCDENGYTFEFKLVRRTKDPVRYGPGMVVTDRNLDVYEYILIIRKPV